MLFEWPFNTVFFVIYLHLIHDICKEVKYAKRIRIIKQTSSLFKAFCIL